ncbi:MAG: hypothetical protein PHI27_05595 [Eubacteriales bacterium]|nr:hypothetical protein [Eubacteriales bacterium]MDD3881707.1 hypothetical protein [Eubacteriales bacterium]
MCDINNGNAIGSTPIPDESAEKASGGRPVKPCVNIYSCPICKQIYSEGDALKQNNTCPACGVLLKVTRKY